MGLEQGVYDEAIGGFYYTAERAEKFIFPAYDGGSIAVIVTTKDHEDVKGFSDAVKQKLKVAPTSAGGGLIAFFKQYNETHPDSQVEYDTTDERQDYDTYLNVANGKYDYDVTNLHQYKKVVEENPDSDVAKKTVYHSFAAIKAFDLFNKNQQDLADAYSEAIEKLRADGTLSELYVKWFGEDIFETLQKTDDEDYGIVFLEDNK
jgi:L-cystine transport system substrate-binding protein